jgi:hypothetical protein
MLYGLPLDTHCTVIDGAAAVRISFRPTRRWSADFTSVSKGWLHLKCDQPLGV